jgi:hypothetical protein
MCNVLFSYANIFIGQVFSCRYLWPFIILYLLFMKQHFVMCHLVSLEWMKLMCNGEIVPAHQYFFISTNIKLILTKLVAYFCLNLKLSCWLLLVYCNFCFKWDLTIFNHNIYIYIYNIKQMLLLSIIFIWNIFCVVWSMKYMENNLCLWYTGWRKADWYILICSNLFNSWRTLKWNIPGLFMFTECSFIIYGR